MAKYEVQPTGQFKKDLKSAKKRGLDLNELFAVVEMLANDIELPEKHHNHLLHGDYNGYWECHINPDWLLLTSDALFVSNSAFFMKKRK